MQISKLEMRILLVIAAVVVGILVFAIVPHLAGSAPATQSPLAQSTPTPTPSVTSTPVPTPSPMATPKTEQQILDDIMATTVSVYSVLVCNNLKDYADKTIPEIITKVLAQYPTTGLSDASRQIMAQRVLTESTAKSCPDESARVAAGIAQG